MIFSAVDKTPSAVLDYVYDWADFLNGDAIATSTFPSPPIGLDIDSSSNTTEAVTIWVSGGNEGRDYQILNRITTTAGRTEDWLLVVRVTQNVVVPTGPPFASVREAVAYQPAAEEAEAMKVEMVLHDASDIVESIAPVPDEIKTTLSLSMDTSQKTIPCADNFSFPEKGVVKIDSEVIYYADKSTLNGLELTRCMRGRLASIPSSHTSGAEVIEVSYPIRRRRAELHVFEWLWDTRGYIPSRTGVVGSQSFDISNNVLSTINRIMGLSSQGEGSIQKVVPMTSFRRFRRSPLDFQRG